MNPTTTGAAGVPDGYKLVPVEPTREMLEAARWHDGINTARHVWADMLASAPDAPASDSDVRRKALEECCAAIKAEDDRMSAEDYMLDSDDCIRVIRALSAQQAKD
jgi:hypothetical protein